MLSLLFDLISIYYLLIIYLVGALSTTRWIATRDWEKICKFVTLTMSLHAGLLLFLMEHFETSLFCKSSQAKQIQFMWNKWQKK